jgi:hypothetical protein
VRILVDTHTLYNASAQRPSGEQREPEVRCSGSLADQTSRLNETSARGPAEDKVAHFADAVIGIRSPISQPEQRLLGQYRWDESKRVRSLLGIALCWILRLRFPVRIPLLSS